MKRFILVLSVLLIGFSLAAATSYKGNSAPSDADKPNLDVTFDLATLKDYQFGFTSFVPESENFDSFDIKSITGDSVALKLDENRNIGILNSNLYVFWKIRSNEKVTISLKANGVMAGKNTSEPQQTLDWTTSWIQYSTDNSQSSGSRLYEDATVMSKDADIYTSYGAVKLSIATADISDKKADSFTGNLVLTLTNN